jgi:hypothetical protein
MASCVLTNRMGRVCHRCLFAATHNTDPPLNLWQAAVYTDQYRSSLRKESRHLLLLFRTWVRAVVSAAAGRGMSGGRCALLLFHRHCAAARAGCRHTTAARAGCRHTTAARAGCAAQQRLAARLLERISHHLQAFRWPLDGSPETLVFATAREADEDGGVFGVVLRADDGHELPERRIELFLGVTLLPTQGTRRSGSADTTHVETCCSKCRACVFYDVWRTHLDGALLELVRTRFDTVRHHVFFVPEPAVEEVVRFSVTVVRVKI